MEFIQDIGFAVLVVAGIAVVIAIAVLAYKLLSLYFRVRREERKREVARRLELEVLKRLNAAGFTESEARDAIKATRGQGRRPR